MFFHLQAVLVKKYGGKIIKLLSLNKISSKIFSSVLDFETRGSRKLLLKMQFLLHRNSARFPKESWGIIIADYYNNHMRTFQTLKHVAHILIRALWRVWSNKIIDLCHVKWLHYLLLTLDWRVALNNSELLDC